MTPRTRACFLPLAAASAVLFALPLQIRAESFLLDFGAAATTTINGPSPDDPLNFWNNITDVIGTNSAGQLLNLVTTTNAASDIDFLMVARFNGSNTNGTLASTLFPMDATRDSLFGNSETFGGLTDILPVFKFAALDPVKTYDFTFYASRGGVADNRETLYTVTGISTNSAVLNVANNIDTTVSLSGISPSPSGEITISLSRGPNNNNANHFTYMGVLRMDAVPEPGVGVILLLGVVGLFSRRRLQLV